MAVCYLLDTNILIASLRGDPAIRQRLETQPLTALRLSTIVLGELEFGAEKSTWAARNRHRLTELRQRMPLVGIDDSTALHYARIRTALERAGTSIGSNDFWIAAQALALGATLVTDNEREFRRVPGLVVENWLRG